jgi:hypothetical protein
MTDLPVLQWHRGQLPATQPAINQEDVTQVQGLAQLQEAYNSRMCKKGWTQMKPLGHYLP